MKWGARVSGIRPGEALIDGQVHAARWIIGADGQNSRVREWSGLARGMPKTFRIGLRRHFRVPRWTDLVEVHWGRNGQTYVTPVADDEVCVAVITRHHRPRFEDVVAECPVLAGRLRFAAPLDDVRGSSTATCSLRSVITDNVALIGEASGSVDAITGEGMALAFRQAGELSDAIASNDPRRYATAHRRIGRLPNLLGSAMLLMDRNARFRYRALKALSANPAMFARLLAVHLGEASPFDISIFANLGWELLTAR
jgi:flavin-dependent dehydrogenase